MVERDFYKLQKLTRADIFILQKLLIEKTASPHLRELHKTLIEQFAYIAEANEKLKVHPNASGADREMVRKLTIEAEEKLHCGVEESAKLILEALRNKDGNVIYSDDTAIPFFDFISHQFFRTKRKRDAIVEAAKESYQPRTYRGFEIYSAIVTRQIQVGASTVTDMNSKLSS